MPPIMAIPFCINFACSDFKALRSSGLRARIIFSCMSRIDFICVSIIAMRLSEEVATAPAPADAWPTGV